MADPLFSTLLADASQWENPNPDYPTITGAVGGTSGSDRGVVRSTLINLSVRSPIVLAFQVAGDTDHIHVGHSMSIFPAELGVATPADDLAVVLVGDNLTNATPFILPHAAFTRTGDISCLTTDTMLGAQGHAAGPPVYRFGPHGNADANVTQVRARPVMPIPPTAAADISSAPEGRYTLQSFYQRFIHDMHTSADAADQALIEPLENWWRVACTDTAAPGESHIQIVPVAIPLPMHQQRVNRWVNRIKEQHTTRLGTGGPTLTTAAFATGITEIRNAMNENATAALDYERTKNDKTFTDKHGAALAQRMYRWTNVVSDGALPEVHQLLAKAPKGRDHGIITSLIATRLQASAVPLTIANAPVPTTKLVDEVFRSFQLSGNGITFAQGLSPFAIVCEGHPEVAQVHQLAKQATLAEQGTSLSLQDAAALTSTDVRLPTTPQIAMEKLYGWSILLDIFHGVDHDIAKTVRKFVIEVAPYFHQIHTQYAENPAIGMDYVCRVLFETQQDYFTYINDLANDPTTAVLPTFASIKHAVISFRVASLAPLPNLWYSLWESKGGKADKKTNEQPSNRKQAGAVPTFNNHADRNHLQRFRDSEFTTISAMMEGKDVAIPQHRGKDICLVWALKGDCSATCKRKDQHVRYSKDTLSAITKLLDKCGAPGAQA